MADDIAACHLDSPVRTLKKLFDNNRAWAARVTELTLSPLF
jgi:hypothetical protein